LPLSEELYPADENIVSFTIHRVFLVGEVRVVK
jgi:hypothetical protein